jgi:hypothetical protein
VEGERKRMKCKRCKKDSSINIKTDLCPDCQSIWENIENDLLHYYVESLSKPEPELLKEEATDRHKETIVKLMEALNFQMDGKLYWSVPFSKYEAWKMIIELKERVDKLEKNINKEGFF